MKYSRAPHTAFIYDDETRPDPRDSSLLYVSNLQTSEILVLENSGSIIWEILATPASEEEIVSSLAEVYEQPPSLVRPSTLAFLAALEEKGLVSKDQ